MNNVVFVLDTERRPLTPCRPAQARRMLRDGKAAVLRRFPFTLILKEARPDAEVKPLTVKIDPGAKVTGLALVDASRVLFAAELTHRGSAIKSALEERRMYRRNRRARKTRHRAPRFDNRVRNTGWLPPSLQHRVETTLTWVRRFNRFAPLEAIALERVKFDMHNMQNPEISGVSYQQGELAGYQVREYLLEKFSRTCVYCSAKDVPLEVEHVQPKALGGSDRVSNLTLACRPCNTKKGALPIEVFLKRRPEVLARLKAQLKKPLAAAAAVNATRNAILDALVATGLPVETGDGAQTKFNRTRQGYGKAHWIDAACVGSSGAVIALDEAMKPLRIKACGHGVRQRCSPDAYGFPRKAAPRNKAFAGYQTGDLVKANVPSGKYAGTYTGRIAIRHRPSFRLSTSGTVFDVHPKHLTKIQAADGYAYA
jgi:5-methylcytosine-specific restriction endonuclease McrA